MLFIFVARYISENAALRYALLAVALVQFLSIFVGRSILNDGEWCEVTKQQPLAPNTLKEPAEL
jgi:YQGE family putative transporter